MNNFQRDLKNDDGTEETVVITSNDNYTLNMNKTYKIANHTQKKEFYFLKFSNVYLFASFSKCPMDI